MDQLIKEYDFASRKKPFFIGIEGIVSHLKTKDGSDYKYRIREFNCKPNETIQFLR
jgi:hypothetical protein